MKKAKVEKGEELAMKKKRLGWLNQCDRTYTDKNGTHYFGFDDEESGVTVWYDEDGQFDSMRAIPANDWNLTFVHAYH